MKIMGRNPKKQPVKTKMEKNPLTRQRQGISPEVSSLGQIRISRPAVNRKQKRIPRKKKKAERKMIRHLPEMTIKKILNPEIPNHQILNPKTVPLKKSA